MKKFVLSLLLVVCTVVLCMTVGFAAEKTVYVSSTGLDTNAGTSADAPVATLAAAYELGATEIILLSDTTYENAPSAYSGTITIKGAAQNVKLIIDPDASNPGLKGGLILDNLTTSGSKTMYANGYYFKVTETVLSEDNLSVFGGGWTTVESTHLELLGGRWDSVYGGSWTKNVTGDTNVIIGGNFNYGYNLASCQNETCKTVVWGGGKAGEVQGKTNITVKDNAVAAYVVGGSCYDSNYSTLSSQVFDTNIYIKGGQVMNVYGGARTVELTGCTTHVTMTGGMVEAIFGGTEGIGMTGHTYINLYGGELTRRVYSGCYNGTSGLSLKSDNYVNGTTVITFAPGFNASLNDSQDDRGLYAGSRVKNQNSAEKNTLIFLDNCYSTFSSKLGCQDSSGKFVGCASHPNYTVKAGVNGKVYGTDVAGEVYIVADKGYYAKVDSDSTWYNNDYAPVGQDSTVTFGLIANDFDIASWIAGNGDYEDFMIVDTNDVNAQMMTYQVIANKEIVDGFDDDALLDIPSNATEISVSAETLAKDIDGIEYGVLYAHGKHDVLDFSVNTAKVHKLASLDVDGGAFAVRIVDKSGETNYGTMCTYVKYGDTYRFGTPITRTLVKCAFFESADRGNTYYVFNE